MAACCFPGAICQHWPNKRPEPLTYHRDIGFPEGLDLSPPTDLWLCYTAHAKRAAQDEGLKVRDLPTRLPASMTIIEVEVLADQVQKWVLRDCNIRYRGGYSVRENYDLVLVVLRDGTVKTVWLNHHGDTHVTLQRHRYTVPSVAVKEVHHP